MRAIDGDALWMDIAHSMDYCEDILEIIERQPTIEPDWTEMMVICDNCGHAIHVKRNRPEGDK